jgi:hypothetical protein
VAGHTWLQFPPRPFTFTLLLILFPLFSFLLYPLSILRSPLSFTFFSLPYLYNSSIFNIQYLIINIHSLTLHPATYILYIVITIPILILLFFTQYYILAYPSHLTSPLNNATHAPLSRQMPTIFIFTLALTFTSTSTSTSTCTSTLS